MDIQSFLAFRCSTAPRKFEVRKQVVFRVNDGKSVASIACKVPFTARTIYRWVPRFALGGFNGLKKGKRTGRPRKWNQNHVDGINKVVVDQTPEQYKFEFALSTAQNGPSAFHQEFGVWISVWTVRRILRMLKITPQRPKRRARKYKPGDVQRWKDEEYAWIAQRAMELDATIVFADESGMSSQCVYGRTWGVKGETPAVRVANSQFLLNMFTATCPEGKIYYMIHEGRGTAEMFCQFLEKVVRESGRKILIVVANSRIYKAKITKKWLKEYWNDCEIHYQPIFSPEVNPVELTWALVKRQVSRQVSKTQAQMRAHRESAFNSLKDSPHAV